MATLTSTIEGLKGKFIQPSDSEDWAHANKRLVTGNALSPHFYVQPADAQDVSLAILWAVQNKVPLAVKNGGNTDASAVNNGLIIDMRNINHTVYDPEHQVIRVGGGCLWGNVYIELHKHGRLTAGGGAAVVGVIGFAAGGGHSWLSSKFGIGADQILSATVVLADGKTVTCSESVEPDLFWAIRGGSSQFGVITEVTLRTYPELGEMFVGTAAFAGRNFGKLLNVTYKWFETRKPEDTLVFGIVQGPPGFDEGMIIINPFIIASEREARKTLEMYLDSEDFAPIMDATFSAKNMNEVAHAADEFLLRPGPPLAWGGGVFFTQLWPGMIEAVEQRCTAFRQDHPECQNVMALFELHRIIRPHGMNTAYHSPSVPFSYAALSARSATKEGIAAAETFIKGCTDIVRDFERRNTGQDQHLLINSSNGFAKEDIWAESYPRLRKLKARYDPNVVFDRFHCIHPDFGETT